MVMAPTWAPLLLSIFVQLAVNFLRIAWRLGSKIPGSRSVIKRHYTAFGRHNAPHFFVGRNIVYFGIKHKRRHGCCVNLLKLLVKLGAFGIVQFVGAEAKDLVNARVYITRRIEYAVFGIE